jgi:hypothetical protein
MEDGNKIFLILSRAPLARESKDADGVGREAVPS